MTNDFSLGLLMDLRNPPEWRESWQSIVGGALELAEEAERLGAGAIWATEHHGFADGYLSQPLTFLAAAAARTHRVRLGTGVLLASFQHPQHVAEQAALVDQISGGRLELGIGAGYSPSEFSTFGGDLTRRMTSADRSAATIRDLLWGDTIAPPPLQERLPMWMGYQGPQGARRAGRLGLGLLCPNPALLPAYRSGLEEGGHDPEIARTGGMLPFLVAEDPDRTAVEVAPYYAHQVDTYAQARTGHAQRTDPKTLLSGLTDPDSSGLQVLSPEEAVRRITEIRAQGPVRHLYMWASISGMGDHLVREHIELTFGKVAPAL